MTQEVFVNSPLNCNLVSACGHIFTIRFKGGGGDTNLTLG